MRRRREEVFNTERTEAAQSAPSGDARNTKKRRRIKRSTKGGWGMRNDE